MRFGFRIEAVDCFERTVGINLRLSKRSASSAESACQSKFKEIRLHYKFL